MYCIFPHHCHPIILKIAFCNLIIFYHKALSFTIRKKRKKKSRSGLSHPNRPLFLRFFTSTLNLRSVQKHHQQRPILKHLDMVQRFQHKIRVHLFQWLCIFRIFYKFLCPVSPARRSSPCICCFHCTRKLSRFSTSAFQTIRYAFTSVSSSTWRLSHP